MKHLLILVFLFSASFADVQDTALPSECPQGDASPQLKCSFDLVESIPEGLTYNESINSVPTSESVLSLIQSANITLDIGHFYFTLKGSDVMSNARDNWTRPGELILSAIKDAARRGVSVRVVADSGKGSSKVDLQELVDAGVQLRRLDVSKLVGAGILHTKLLIVDNSSFYVGSANMDWRSFTQVKEMGVTIKNCPLLAVDIGKIFEIYWINSDLPSFSRPSGHSISTAGHEVVIPDYLDTEITADSPATIKLNNLKHPTKVYISSSPFKLNSKHRANDVDTILDMIHTADKFVDIAVMDYYPMFLYRSHRKNGSKSSSIFWPIIDDAIKRAVIDKGINVRLLCSYWKSTRPSMVVFLKSLQAFSSWSKPKNGSNSWTSNRKSFKNFNKGSIQVKLFQVPSNDEQDKIPFARVNHNKYMVTDRHGYIGTNNWSADYFVSTAGIGFVAEDVNATCYSDNSIRQQLKHAFDRDWNSGYAHDLSNF